MRQHSSFYQLSEYYDIAFDFRDVKKQCDFIEAVFRDSRGRAPDSFLELGAGPAWHTIEFASRGVRAAALDISPAMVDYGLSKANVKGVSITYHSEDMISYSLPETFDCVVLLLDSASYLLDNEAVYAHFRSVSGSLEKDGIYIMELSHPKDVFRVGKTAETSWTFERDGKKVTMQWGRDSDHFDPVRQITDVTVTLTVTENGRTTTYSDRAPQRCFTLNELKALIDASNCFQLIGIFGDLDQDISIDHHKAWRIIAVLRKTTQLK